jgi:hypothetical protein
VWLFLVLHCHCHLMMIFNKLMPELIDHLVTEYCVLDFELCRIDCVWSFNNISFIGTDGNVAAVEVIDGLFYILRLSKRVFCLWVCRISL